MGTGQDHGRVSDWEVQMIVAVAEERESKKGRRFERPGGREI
jgi:hypothetical protein